MIETLSTHAVTSLKMKGWIFMSEMDKKSNNSSTDTPNIYWYEAIFLNNDEILSLFNSIRNIMPYSFITENFHVTTEFMPSNLHEQWYGEKVSVRITSYKSQTVTADNGMTTANEGFKVVLSAENKALLSYLNLLNKNFHITGSYQDAAKYTEQIDFSDGIKMNIEIIGIYGYCDPNNIIHLNSLN